MNPMETLYPQLDQLIEIGLSLSGETEIDRLLERILLTAKQMTHADGGTLYTLSEDRQRLQFRILRTDSLGLAFGGTQAWASPTDWAAPLPTQFTDLPLFLENGQPNHHMVAAHVALSGETANIPDVYTETRFDFSGTRRFDASTGYRSVSFLTVPLKNHAGEVIGVLQLINAMAPRSRTVRAFTAGEQRLIESLASQAAVALTNRLLIRQLEALFEALVQLITTAIDEKSPHTGGHCARVPELTMMLAEAVNETREGPLADVTLTERDRYELRIAALLHDCGKITTPVHIVDKATKLQTIFDRIGLIDTRFEIARRDLEIAFLKGEMSREQRDARMAALQADQDFLRKANIGSESMKEADVSRVRDIAHAYRWIGSEGDEKDFLDTEEIENLSIRYGTLTDAERQIINHHIELTIRMLERLPWPKHLRNVPEYAGGHHERMDGKGYPRGLTRDQMSVQARCMGIADIFEALTASDRPYKPGKKLSEALQILGRMKLDGHIDPDLFNVFIWEKVYQSYAEKYLPPEQIDAIDETGLPGYEPRPG